ncbi:MAG TPA: hypothetical protein VMY78_05930 [Solirubrobacteraceae bacterium]|nr:hypothetical protein [Solirubrobacteraceae bacterium]
MRARTRQPIIPLVFWRATKTMAAAAASLALVGAATADAFVDVENTGPGLPDAFGHVTSPPALLDGLLAIPFDPLNADPVALAALRSPDDPETDLAAALVAMQAAPDAPAADAARRRALDILEGNESPATAATAYHGIGLLNWKVKVKAVPAGGTVTVRQVRWGEHVINDTWLLDFAAPTSPYSIRYEVVELGNAFGGELSPTPLLADGATVIGGQHSAIQPLGVDGNQPTGTTQSSRFTIARGLGAVDELTRSAAQTVTVAMPPANVTSAILDPNVRPGHDAVAALKPATPEQIAAARAAMDFSATATDDENKLAAIDKLSDGSPEKQIWAALRALGPAPAGDPEAATYLTDAHTAGAANRELVGEMRARTDLPAGIDTAGADVTVVLQNNEAYVSRTALRVEPGANLSLRVVNRDKMDHDVSALDLHDRTRILGATDWGEFGWTDRNLDPSSTLGPGEARTFTLGLAEKSFTLWVGDLTSGDQAGTTIAIDREMQQEALRFGATTVPVHSAPDAAGNLWVTLLGVDTIARVTPAARLADSTVHRFLVPGGKHAVDSATPPLAPSDITVDGRGIVFTTLSSGNAIARINPSQVQNATDQGMTILPLDACPIDVCRPEVPPVPNEQPTRRPTRIKSYIDGQGHTVLWFTEAGASRIGVMRVSQAGTVLNQAHFECACEFPESLDLGPDGSVWFAEIFENRIGRVIPDPLRPFAASAATVQHFDIPSSTPVEQPPLTTAVNTSLPLSLAVDGRNRVWFSQSSLSGAAYLDPAAAQPGTSQGCHEFGLPDSDFHSPAAPADVMVDRANNFWWTGEYGDQIEQRKPDTSPGLRFRGSVRRGLTEGPVADAQGNLWVVESGGNLITRISGVTAGPLRPAGLPAGFEADTTRDRVSGARLADATSVEVRVVRADNVVASASVPVSGGSFDVAAADWQGATEDEIRPDDVVRVFPKGPHDRTELSFAVARLAGAIRPDGSLAGTAFSGTQALSDRITVTAGGVTDTAPITGGSGAWSIAPPQPLAPDAALSLSWSSATVAGTFRTVTSLGGSSPKPPVVTVTDPGPTDQPPAGDPPPAGQAPATAPAAGTPATTPKAPATTAPTARDRACASRHWLYGSEQRPNVLLLDMTRTQVIACLGAPGAKTAAAGTRLERWTYGRGLVLRFRAGRVVDYELRDGRFGTSRRKAGVGSSLRSLRRELPGLRRDRATGAQRVLLRRPDGRDAEIRVRLDAKNKVRNIAIAVKAAAAR